MKNSKCLKCGRIYPADVGACLQCGSPCQVYEVRTPEEERDAMKKKLSPPKSLSNRIPPPPANPPPLISNKWIKRIDDIIHNNALNDDDKMESIRKIINAYYKN